MALADNAPAQIYAGARKPGRLRINQIVLNAVLILFCFIMVTPWLLALSTALKAPGETDLNPGPIPQHIDLTKFVEVFWIAHVPQLALNSVIVTGSTVVLVLLFASLAAYAFARLDFIFKEFFYFLFLIGLMLQAAVLIVPLYQINVAYGLLNTHAGLIGPYVALGMPFSILILRGFFESLPGELQDAALMDGASRFTIYSRIYLPLTRPALTTVAIFQGLGVWNDFLLPLLMTSKPSMQTLPMGLLAFITSFIARTEYRFALIIIMVVPVFIAFLLLQRQFMSGLTAGAIKG